MLLARIFSEGSEIIFMAVLSRKLVIKSSFVALAIICPRSRCYFFLKVGIRWILVFFVQAFLLLLYATQRLVYLRTAE